MLIMICNNWYNNLWGWGIIIILQVFKDVKPLTIFCKMKNNLFNPQAQLLNTKWKAFKLYNGGVGLASYKSLLFQLQVTDDVIVWDQFLLLATRVTDDVTQTGWHCSPVITRIQATLYCTSPILSKQLDKFCKCGIANYIYRLLPIKKEEILNSTLDICLFT